MSVLGRGRGSWKKPDKVKRFPTVVGAFADRGSDAIDSAAKRFMQESELNVNSRCLEDCVGELVRQHSGGLLVEHLPVEYRRAYSTPITLDWSYTVEKCPELTEGNAPGVGAEILYNSTIANYINQEAENSWVVEVLAVQSTVDISIKIDDDTIEKCSLCALEDLHADKELTVFLNEVLCQREFNCHVVSLENTPSVVLYDNNSNVNMNLRFAEQTVLQAAPIQLKEGMSPCVKVTHIADKLSLVCVRLTEQYFELLKNSLNMVMRLKCETKRKRFVVCKKDMKKLCALQINSNWYRVAVESQSSLTEVTVKLVDVGSLVAVDPFSLIVLDSISAVFSNVPSQAVEVALDPVHNAAYIHDLLLSSKNQKSELVMKVLKSDTMQLPFVVFRDPADKISSPKVVGDSFQYQCVDSSVNTLTTSLSALSISQLQEEKPRLSSNDKSSPVVSNSEGDVKYWKSLVGKHFKVYVSSATSPLDIMLQLSKNKPALEMLMEMIQEHYVSRTASMDDPGEIQLKTAYAAFFKDWWYRVRIVSVCGEEAWVHLMDYGNKVSVQLQQIRTLPKEFGQEILPFQSLRAELKGARELISTKEDDDKDLGNILSHKTFTCKVWNVENDHLCPAHIEVDLFNVAGDSIFEVLYAAAASAC